jgi:hypothetical protein
MAVRIVNPNIPVTNVNPTGVRIVNQNNPTNPTNPGTTTNPLQSYIDKINNTTDIGTLISIYRGAWNPQLGDSAHDINALAGDKLSSAYRPPQRS